MQILTSLLDLIFPPRETELELRSATTATLPFAARRVYGCTSLSSYQHPLVRAAVIENKFYQHPKAAQLLSTPLQIWLTTIPGEVILIPIPLGPRRKRERGHNQVASILDRLPRQPQHCIEPSLIQRPKDTLPQTSLQKAHRQTNLKTAFTCGPVDVDYFLNKTIVIVDDVCTTGATLHAAKAALAPHLPPHTPLFLVAIAH
jgi:predicted amidophosphoribosyltransferase